MPATAAPPPAIVIPLGEDAQAATPPNRIEIAVTAPSTQQCDRGQSDEIVVCAPDSVVYRLGAVHAASGQKLPKAELKLSGNTTVAAQLQSGSLGNTPTNRAMVTVKVAF